MEKFVNDVVFRLSNKLSMDNVIIVKNILYLVLKDYELTEKSTELTVIEEELPKEAKIYLITLK